MSEEEIRHKETMKIFTKQMLLPKEELALQTMELLLDKMDLEDRINKAVEYIENNSLYDEEYDYNYEEEMYLSGIDDEVAKKYLLSLLKGDKE